MDSKSTTIGRLLCVKYLLKAAQKIMFEVAIPASLEKKRDEAFYNIKDSINEVETIIELSR